MPTPLLDALNRYAAAAPLRAHMPGHKGTLSPLDLTELPPTGNLYQPDGPIAEAQALWAQAVGFAHCLFLTNGATAGIFAALAAATKPGDHLLLDRDSHLAFHHAMAALDLHPHVLNRSFGAPITAAAVEQAMLAQPNVKTICITSPTYYGVLSDIAAIAAVVHAHDGVLLVDGAHGAHLPFLLGTQVYAGADLLVLSAHKTLRALGQSALLLSSLRFPHEMLRRCAQLFQTSSPSYLLMASLDAARNHMAGAGLARYRQVTAQNRWSLGDPGRIVIHTDGLAWAKRLMEKGIYPELWNQDYVVFILTDSDSDADLARLTAEIALAPPPLPPISSRLTTLPKRHLSPRQALLADRETLPLDEAEGRIAAAVVAPYPPGIPVVAPGEMLDKKTIAYLKEILYNEDVEVVSS
jgi:Arginine/lysine/ornithine decarboxylases